MNKDNTLGLNIKKHRQSKNISRKELADKLGCSVHTIEKYEQGQRTPNINILCNISDILDIKLTDILDKEEKEHIQKIGNEFNSKINNFIKDINPIILSDDKFVCEEEKFKHLEKDQIEFYYKNTYEKYANVVLNTQNLPDEAIKELEDFSEYLKYKYSKPK